MYIEDLQASCSAITSTSRDLILKLFLWERRDGNRFQLLKPSSCTFSVSVDIRVMCMRIWQKDSFRFNQMVKIPRPYINLHVSPPRRHLYRRTLPALTEVFSIA